MKESLQNIGDLVAEPSATFSRLKSQPRSGVVFVIFYLFSVLIGWAVMPYTEAMIDASLSRNNLQTEELEAAESIAQIFKNIGIFIFPIFAILGFIISGALLKLGARYLLRNETLRFRHIYAAVIHVALINCVIQLVNTALLLVFRDASDVKSVADFKMIPGLHMLFDSDANVKLLVFLSHINPLSLWLIAVMAIAIAVLADLEKTRSRIAAVILWLLMISYEVIFAS